MDLSFARRHKAPLRVGTPSLQVLLSAAAARQSLSLTARAQMRESLHRGDATHGDPRIALFAGEGVWPATGSIPASFALEIATPLNPRQSS